VSTEPRAGQVTFAAAKIERLTGELWKAAKAGVKVRLILEFEESSEGQLSYDALIPFARSSLCLPRSGKINQISLSPLSDGLRTGPS
jgi:hypothetical protein